MLDLFGVVFVVLSDGSFGGYSGTSRTSPWTCPSETDCSLSTVAFTAATAVDMGEKIIGQQKMFVRVAAVAAVVA